jgi:thioesterase domain-containing protein
LVHQLLGDVLVYRAIADCFAPDRRVYGIHPPEDFTKRTMPYPLEALAAEYVAEILQQQSVGPFHLSGYSSGAVLAFEMARQMTAAGLEVGLLALIGGDIISPPPHLSPLKNLWKVTARTLIRIAYNLTGDLRKGPKEFFMTRLRYQRVLWRVRQLQEAHASPQESEITLENSYRPQPYSGSALLLRFRDEAWRYGPDPLMGWGRLITEGIEAVDVPGGHFTGMSPSAAPNLVSIMKSRMENIESKRTAEIAALA